MVFSQLFDQNWSNFAGKLGAPPKYYYEEHFDSKRRISLGEPLYIRFLHCGSQQVLYQTYEDNSGPNS